MEGVDGAGLHGNKSSSTFTGTGLTANVGETADCGHEESKGVKINVFWAKSHSAVNVIAVCGGDGQRYTRPNAPQSLDRSLAHMG